MVALAALALTLAACGGDTGLPYEEPGDGGAADGGFKPPADMAASCSFRWINDKVVAFCEGRPPTVVYPLKQGQAPYVCPTNDAGQPWP